MQPNFQGLLSSLILALALTVACTQDNDDGKASEVTRGSRDAGPSDAGPNDGFDQGSAKLTLSCRSAVLTETETAGFVAKVTDAEGRVPGGKGLFVRLSPSGGTISAAKAGGAETDEQGEVKFSYIAPHFDFATNVTLEVSVVGDKGSVLVQSQCMFKVVTEAVRFVAPAKDAYVRSERSSAVELEILVDGTPRTCDAGGGVALTLTGPSGAGLATSDAATFERELCVDLSDDGRAASVLVRGGTSGAGGRLRAKLGEASAELPLKFVGPVAALMLTADATEVEIGSAANLSLAALDNIGQPVASVNVTLALTRCAAAACTGGEAISPETVTTDTNGKASAAYFAGDKAGAAQLTAAVQGDRGIATALVIRVAPMK